MATTPARRRWDWHGAAARVAPAIGPGAGLDPLLPFA